MAFTRSSTKRLKAGLSSSDEPRSEGFDDRLQEVAHVFDYFKPTGTLLATNYLASVQKPYFNALQGFCANMIATNTRVHEEFENITDRWDARILALIEDFQEAADIFNQYETKEQSPEDCALALKNVFNRILLHRENSPSAKESSQRNPILTAEIILFILEEVLERTMPYTNDMQLYHLLIATPAEEERLPWLYENLVNLPSHIPPHHAIRIRIQRVIHKQSLLGHEWINSRVLSRLERGLAASLAEEPSEESEGNEGSSSAEESEESDEDDDDDDTEA